MKKYLNIIEFKWYCFNEKVPKIGQNVFVLISDGGVPLKATYIKYFNDTDTHIFELDEEYSDLVGCFNPHQNYLKNPNFWTYEDSFCPS